MTGANDTDTPGPWFDGVKHLSQKEPDIVNVNAAKRKTIAIAGTSMSGLMIYLVLHQAGFINITMSEASNCIGAGADAWKTVDGGLSRLPQSFQPLVGKNLRFNTKIELQKAQLPVVDIRLHRGGGGFRFTVVRQWRLPLINVTMLDAIKNLVYDTSCKAVLEFQERFWEKLDNPV
ncbi:L-amino-acid oxidase precursor [Metarhizium acridum CQMa 102]|uniref:L-amino-acid oxidase n=1 Tax=Metarhizium acridum (strain CQMa 102) TaxID=655827 RepID=E9DXX5_METAQ|nr:L-amino-acid oxidase precursor [Metarhizium acridum CQMa 102]EFY91588.1 L-amino-acid oxidase precursor [Metarhizium acridum CQMa 102]